MAALVLPASASAGSLPDDRFGERPGPPLLYRDLPVAPELSVDAPFRADPLLVSGTDAYRDGEYLYQDYLFDDHGADTLPGEGNQSKPGPSNFSPAAGDVAYPTAERYAANAADFVELRIKPTAEAIVYRVTLNTVKEKDAAIVGIGVDEDRSGGDQVEWPDGAGISSPGLDSFITAWGTGGRVTTLPGDGSQPLPPGAVDISRRTNQMEIRVPRSILNPGGATWRYVAGAGVHDGSGGFEAVATGASTQEDMPTSGGPESAPAVFNLAFRFDEPQFDEPQPGGPAYTTAPGVGNFFEDEQARVLSEETSGGFHADVDFSALASGADERIHAPGAKQARILTSGLDYHEGVEAGFNPFGGRLQPYLLTKPSNAGEGPAGLTFSLHSLGGTYTQFAVFSPRQQQQFGEQRDDFVVTPLARGPDGFYTDEAEADTFEAWRDAAAHFNLDSERTYITGYSMGGYGAYKLGTQYPDLFARAFTTVGPPARALWLPPAPPVGDTPQGNGPTAYTNSNLVLENVRSVPFLNWVSSTDQLVPIPGPLAQQRRFDALGLRSRLRVFTPADHFTLAILDRFDEARDFLGNATTERRPSRVNYAFVPAADRPRLGLIHDHAYWVSDLEARDESGDPGTDPARGEIDARSQAFGEGEPTTARVTGGGAPGSAGPPLVSTIEGTRWTGIPGVPERNRLVVGLENVGRGTIDGRGAKLDGAVGRTPLRVRLESDGDGRMRLDLRLPKDAVARRIDGGAVSSASGAGGATAAGAGAPAPEVALTRRGANFRVAGGEREYRIFVPASGGGDGGSDTGGEDGDDGSGGGSTTDGGSTGAGAPTDQVAQLGATAGSGNGGSLPFTGLALLALVLLGSAALLTGRALRRAA